MARVKTLPVPLNPVRFDLATFYDVLRDFFFFQNEAVMKTVKFYNVCIDKPSVEARGDGPLKKLIVEMGGWHVTGNMTPLSSMNIIERIGKVSRELFIKPFVDVTVFIDPHDSNRHILQVSSPLGHFIGDPC